MREKINKDIGVDGDFFEHVAIIYYNDDFNGVVIKKYIDWDQHGFMKIVLRDIDGKEREVRLDYEWQKLFDFIKVGDTILKKEKSLDMRLRRIEIDTMIRLNFSNIKNSENYIDFLYNLDSLYTE